jgi:hypothetical protein
MDCHTQSLLAAFGRIADPRRREGRRYRLSAVLGLIVVGALQGEDSLRGIWVWARSHWPQLWWPLGFGSAHFPTYNTLRNLLARLDVEAVDGVVSDWLERVLGHRLKQVSADGKVLRGSRRARVPGLAVVAMASHDLGMVLGQMPVSPGEGELDALLRLLRVRPLAGRVVTLDAGLLTSEVTQVLTEGGGDYVGTVKGNHGEVKAAIDEWVAEQISPLGQGAAKRRPSREQSAAAGTRRPDEREIPRATGNP